MLKDALPSANRISATLGGSLFAVAIERQLCLVFLECLGIISLGCIVIAELVVGHGNVGIHVHKLEALFYRLIILVGRAVHGAQGLIVNLRDGIEFQGALVLDHGLVKLALCSQILAVV